MIVETCLESHFQKERATSFVALERPTGTLWCRMAAPPPPRAIWQVDLASKEDPASPAYLAADRNPQRRQEYKQARASLPAAGLKMGTDINAHTASTWLPVQRNGEQLRSTRAK